MRHNIGIIGCGGRADYLIYQIAPLEKKFKIVALSDVCIENTKRIADKYSLKDASICDNYKLILQREDIGAVLITSPDNFHEEQTIEAFRAGKHVFLEKPISLTLEGAKRILEERDKSGKKLIIGFTLRYNRIYTKIKEIIDSGMIGKLTTAWVLHSVKSGGNWYFHDWHGLMKNTAGLLLQKGSHDFDIINWMTGSNVKSVYALGSRDVFGGDKDNSLKCTECCEGINCPEYQTYEPMRTSCAFRKEIDVLDNHLVLMEYENGVKATYNECHYTPDDNREFIFIGTEGKILSNYLKNEVVVKLRKKSEIVTYNDLCMETEGHGGGDKEIIQDLIKVLDNDSTPIAGGEDGLEAIRIGLMAHESIRTGNVIYKSEFH